MLQISQKCIFFLNFYIIKCHIVELNHRHLPTIQKLVVVVSACRWVSMSQKTPRIEEDGRRLQSIRGGGRILWKSESEKVWFRFLFFSVFYSNTNSQSLPLRLWWHDLIRCTTSVLSFLDEFVSSGFEKSLSSSASVLLTRFCPFLNGATFVRNTQLLNEQQSRAWAHENFAKYFQPLKRLKMSM